MKLSNIIKGTLAVLSIFGSATSLAEENNCSRDKQTQLEKVVTSKFFRELSVDDQVQFLFDLYEQGIDLNSDIFELIDIDTVEKLTARSSSTVLTKPK